MRLANNSKLILLTLFWCYFIGIGVAWSQADTSTTAETPAEETPATNEEAAGAPDQAILDKGKQLFENNCVSCHGLTDAVVVGPGLKGILERRTEEWLIPWIRNSQKVIASGDEYAVNLYKEYNEALMTSFDWPDEDIKAVIAYVDYASKNPPKVDDGGGEVAETGGETTAGDSGFAGYFNILLGVLLVVMVMILAVLLMMVSVLKRYLAQQEGLSEDDKEYIETPKFSLGSLVQNRAFIGGIALVFVLVVLKSGLDGLINVGVQQGYAPTQPIAFSHKLHAGMYEIDCAYCHTGVYKGKSATIPSANICMNCHNAIKRESPEIKKIYAALEKDEPIEWIRVHNLPDLAYFNHAQHTNVAGLDCQNCHGEIEQMEVVQQRAPLTMGWCINCHRETVTDHAKDNAYYDKLIEYHDQNGNKPMTVENIGGLECSKCHY